MTFVEAIFEFLFKYRFSVFRQGEIAFGAPRALVVGALALGLVVAAFILWLARRKMGARVGLRDRVLLAVLRLGALAVIVLCLLQPSLVLSVVVPQQSFVGVLLDDTRSMLIQDQGEESRGAFLTRTLNAETGELYKALAERFKVRLFAFSQSLRRIDDVSELRFDGGETHLAPALQGAVEELTTVPLSGLVLLSDGADNSAAPLEDALLELGARSVPVFTVGLGSERYARDIEVNRVTAPPTVLKGSSLVVEVTLNQTGYSGTTVNLDVEDSGRIVNSQEVRFATGGEAATVQVHLTAGEAGVRRFRFRVPPRPGERVTRNNEQVALIHVEDRVEKVLYFEGEPRWELKFIRRAVADDENLQVVALQRTAENKFLRLQVDSPDELQGGFPTTEEELFAYRGIILGSVEASFFTYDQLRMIAEFVSQRGGGFLMLGGRSSFAEGGYGGTPVDELLPVVLGPSSGGGEGRGSGDGFFSLVEVKLTPYGRTHPALRLGASEEESAERWASLPPLSVHNPIARLKPGAISLLEGVAPELDGNQVVLAHQRYGRGRSLAFTVHDSWIWQMHADIGLEDLTHETLWRQLLRWLVSYVPDPVVVRVGRDRVAPGDVVSLVAEVRDETFLAVNSAEVSAEVRSPTGETSYLPMEWTVEKDGEYRASFTAGEEGRYEVDVVGRSADKELGSAKVFVDAGELATEYFDSEQRPALLRRIAEETGGRNYTPASATHLAEDLSYAEGGSTVLEHQALWDMPVLFLLVVLFLAGEWTLRKARGLV